MKALKKIASVVIAGLVVVSCANDVDGFISIPDAATGVQQISTRGSSDNLKIVYHGKVYETLYTIINDSTYLYQNSEVKDLIDNLNETRPNLRTFIHGDGVIEYFDDENDFNLNKERIMSEYEKELLSTSLSERWFPTDNIPQLAPIDPENDEVEIYLYEDPYYLGGLFSLQRSRSDSDYDELSKVWNFGGQISSMIVHTIGFGGIFTFYERMGCQGKGITLVLTTGQYINLCSELSADATRGISYGSIAMSDLRNLNWSGIAGNWNNRICCIKVDRYTGMM